MKVRLGEETCNQASGFGCHQDGSRRDTSLYTPETFQWPLLLGGPGWEIRGARVQGGRGTSHLPPSPWECTSPPHTTTNCRDRVGASLRPWSRISVSLDIDRPEIGSYSHGRKRRPPTLPSFLFVLLFPSARSSTEEIQGDI